MVQGKSLDNFSFLDGMLLFGSDVVTDLQLVGHLQSLRAYRTFESNSSKKIGSTIRYCEHHKFIQFKIVQTVRHTS